MALLKAVFISICFALAFTAIVDIFNIYLAIRFINYVYRFYIIEIAIEGDQTDIEPAMNDNTPYLDSANFNALEKRIEEWVATKGFTEKGITINVLVSKLYTNRYYLSTYINTYKKKNFREWINELRVEEAKHLLLEYPNMNINEIASRVGFATQSHFGQQFRTSAGLSPQNYRKQADG
jgi:AraC-like DNA-binding protein